jgi:hypothetical protein
MKHTDGFGIWLSIGFIAALAVDILIFSVLGVNQAGISSAVVWAARVSFLFFWLTYAGGAIQPLFGLILGTTTNHSRGFGLGFAGALIIHLCGVVWLFLVSQQQPISNAGIVYFGIGALWAFTLVLCSGRRFQALLSPGLRRILSFVGLEYIAFLFLLDFVIGPLRSGHSYPLGYVPFATLILAALMLRWGTKTWRWIHSLRRDLPYGAV